MFASFDAQGRKPIYRRCPSIMPAALFSPKKRDRATSVATDGLPRYRRDFATRILGAGSSVTS